MEKYIDILIERAKILKNWKEYMPMIAKVIKDLLPDSQIYIFGSVIKGKAVGGSDIDILIVSNSTPKDNLGRAKIKVKIEQLCNLPPHHPFEFHLVNEEEAKWYFDRIKELKNYEF